MTSVDLAPNDTMGENNRSHVSVSRSRVTFASLYHVLKPLHFSSITSDYNSVTSPQAFQQMMRRRESIKMRIIFAC